MTCAFHGCQEPAVWDWAHGLGYSVICDRHRAWLLGRKQK